MLEHFIVHSDVDTGTTPSGGVRLGVMTITQDKLEKV